MASAADKEPGAESAGAPAGTPDHEPRVTRALTSIIDSAPAAPASAERLDAAPREAPQDASERFAFALWGAGRKDEAVEFLERQIARHKTPEGGLTEGATPEAAPAEAAPSDLRSSDMHSRDMRLDLAPTHVIAVPRPPIPKRPIVLAGAAVAAAMWLVWPGSERLAALPERVGLPQLAFWAEEPAPEAAPAPVVIAAKEELGEDLPSEASGEAGPPRAALDEELIDEAATRAVADTTRDASSPPEPTVTGSTAAAPESSEIDHAEGDIPFEAEAAIPIEADADAPVTLQTLAAGVETTPRLPRPRPEPSPQLVAALNAPTPASPVAVAQQWRIVEPPVRPAAVEDDPLIVRDYPIAGEAPSAAPLVVVEPPQPAGPYAAAAPAPRGLTIIGRVTGPIYAVPRAANRFVTTRRARAAERAAIRRQASQWSPRPVATWSPQPALPWNAAPPSERWRYPPPPTYEEPYYGGDDDSWYD